MTGPLSSDTVHNVRLLEAPLTLAGPAHHHIVVEGLGEAALDLKVVDLDAHSLASHAVPWPGRAGCLCQCLQGDSNCEMVHMLKQAVGLTMHVKERLMNCIPGVLCQSSMLPMAWAVEPS